MTASPGRRLLARGLGGDGRTWELWGRVEPLPGCAADVPAGYRLALVASAGAEGGEGEAVRVRLGAVYPTWEEAAAALKALADPAPTGPPQG
jgi:hypothetical protein